MNVREFPADRGFELVKLWGYPRALDGDDADAYWITDIPQTGLVWLIRLPLEKFQWYTLHSCVAPEHRLRRSHGEVFLLVRWVAGLLGAQRVYAPLLSTRPGWARYLERCGGFTERDALGPYFEIPTLEGLA